MEYLSVFFIILCHANRIANESAQEKKVQKWGSVLKATCPSWKCSKFSKKIQINSSLNKFNLFDIDPYILSNQHEIYAFTCYNP